MEAIRTIGAKMYNPFTPRWSDRSIFDYVPATGRTLNVGSGNTPKLNNDTANLDIKKLPNVDVVADAHSLPFGDSSFDCVFCRAVLEHTVRPWIVASEIQRVLRTGGVACILAPFLEAIHDEHDYFRITLKGLKSLFPELVEVKSGVSHDAMQMFADVARIYPVLVFENTRLKLPVAFAMSWIAKPLQYLDFTIRNRPSMSKYARAYYFIGRKTEGYQEDFST